MMNFHKPRLITQEEEKLSALPRRESPKPLIFHDGRLVVRPTPLNSLTIGLWAPMGILLSLCCIFVGLLLPYKLGLMGCAGTGIHIRAQMSAPRADGHNSRGNVVYMCNHRTLLDPVFISVAVQRRVSPVTCSLSRLLELISPIPTVRLTRERSKDEATMRWMLKKHGDLAVCPEGTTCRERYLLTFSSLFAEIADEEEEEGDSISVVPVAVMAEGSMFYRTTVRGYKC